MTTQTVQTSQTSQTSQTAKTAQNAQASAITQPYGNQAALQDAGIQAAPASPLSEEAAYYALLAASWVDYAAVLEQCLDQPNTPAAHRWMQHQHLDDVAENAPALLDRAREVMWPMNRRVSAQFAGKYVNEFGGEVAGQASTERSDDGFRVELQGEAKVDAGFDGLKANLPVYGDENLLFGAGADATLAGGYRVAATWDLPADAMDSQLLDVTIVTGLDALIKSVDMLIENLTMPDELKIESLQTAEAGAAVGAGIGASAGAETEQALGFGYDADCAYATGSISGGVAVGFDTHALAALGAAIGDGVADFKGSVSVRAELPNDWASNPTPPRYFFCWSTASETNNGKTEAANTSSTWVEVGLLQSAITLMRTLLRGDADAGEIAVADLPDRTLVRAVEHRIEDQTFVANAMGATGLDHLELSPLPLVQEDCEVRAIGEIRVTTAAVAAALGGARSLNASGESAEDAVLDAERQIAAFFLGEHYEWDGAAQIERGLANALPACGVQGSRLEASRNLHIGAQTGPGSMSAGTTITEIMDITPAELRNYMAL